MTTQKRIDILVIGGDCNKLIIFRARIDNSLRTDCFFALTTARHIKVGWMERKSDVRRVMKRNKKSKQSLYIFSAYQIGHNPLSKEKEQTKRYGEY